MKTNSFYVLHNGKNQVMNELSQEIECALNIRNLSCNSSVSTLYFLTNLIFRKYHFILPCANKWNVVWAFLAFILGKNIYIGIHDVEGHDPADKTKVHYYNFMIAYFSRNVITFSEFSANQLFQKYGRKSLIYRFKTNLNINISTKERSVLIFGRFKEYQGRNLLEQIVARLPDTRFHVWGKNAPAELRKYSNVDLITDFVEQEELEKQIAASKVVLMPYLSATQSGHIPLVLSFGTQVVAFDVGALKEQMYPIEGYFAPSGDVEELLKKIRLSIVADNLTYKEVDTWMIYQNNLNSKFFQELII
jgi:glycosyltransferase involved in cell wall biosynthesis